MEKVSEVTPGLTLSEKYFPISRSALISQSLAVESSLPVANAVPDGKYLKN